MHTTRIQPKRVCDIRIGEDIHFDAWLYSMLMDNNLAYNLNPHLIASQEQLGFMVQLSEHQIYLPCSDQTFALLGQERFPFDVSSPNPDKAHLLQKQYNRAWRIITRLIRSSIADRETRVRLFRFCGYRFRQSIAQHTLIPQRLVKRMTDLVLKQGFQRKQKLEGLF